MRWGQVERRCGKVRGRSDESAPVSGSPGVYTAGQGHDRCYHMRVLDPISTLVAAADGDGVWEAGSRGSWGKGGVRAEEKESISHSDNSFSSSQCTHRKSCSDHPPGRLGF